MGNQSPESFNPSDPSPMTSSYLANAGSEEKRKHLTEETQHFASGAERSTHANHVRYDLISPEGLRRIAARYKLGCEKYKPHNWEQGLPVSDTINHALNHIFKYLEGNTEDDDLAAAAWNLIAVMHFEKHNPECMDIPTRMKKESTDG